MKSQRFLKEFRKMVTNYTIFALLILTKSSSLYIVLWKMLNTENTIIILNFTKMRTYIIRNFRKIRNYIKLPLILCL